MSEKILVPVLGESITEATVSKWLKNKGETVDADEPIVELETDKVNLEVPSPVAGKLIEMSGGLVAGFIFVINLYDLPGKKLLEKKSYLAESLIDFPGH